MNTLATSLSLLMPLIVGLAALLTAAACGGGNDDGGDSGGDDNGRVSFDVSMTENKFDPTEFTVAAGSTVTFNLANDGAAIHNMRIAGEDAKYNSDDDTVSDPDLVNGGETATLAWTAPDSPGETNFQCDIHPTDMLGLITVE